MKGSFKMSDDKMHSDEIKDIITKVPSWILRWGLTIFLCILILIVGISDVIKYPNYVKAQLILRTSDPFEPVLAKVHGKFIKLLVKENEIVTIGQPLAFIENDADVGKVLRLETNLKQLREGLLHQMPLETEFLYSSDYTRFGGLKKRFHQFFLQYQVWLNSSCYHKSIQVKKEYLESNLNKDKCKLKFLEALNGFIETIEEWKSKYILVANTSGRVKFVNKLESNDVFQIGQEVFYIEPIVSELFGEIKIPENNINQVAKGQDVIIKFVAYPFQTYGIQKGKIDFISDMAYDDGIYNARVELEQVSSFENKKAGVHLKPGMLAEAEIVIQNTSFLQRIMSSLFKF